MFVTETAALPVVGSAANTAASPASLADSRASYSVQPGGLYIRAASTLQSVGAVGASAGAWASSMVSARLSDVFVLNVGNAAPGTLFTVQANIFVSGLLHSRGQASDPGAEGNAGYSALSTWFAEVALYNSTRINPYVVQANGFCRDIYGVGPTCAGDSFGNFTRVFTAAVGQPNELHLFGDVSSIADAAFGNFGSTSAQAFADLGHAIGWGGIQSVMDANGNSVAGFSAFSASSGFDYSQAYVSAVPEPGIWLSLGLGVLLLASRNAAVRRRAERD